MAWLTEQDVQNYGTELIDVTQRAALHAISPELQDIRNQNAELQRRLAQEARHRLDQQVAAAVPDYQTIDRDPNWHRWLLGYDTYTGQVRQQLLNDAIASGQANRVIAFFKGYLRESGNQSPGSAATTSGRTRSFGKPVYTRDQIAQLYSAHRQGAYAGQEQAWARQEADIFAAQREGRVQGLPYLTK
jgi:hypothetical protein